MEGGKGGGGAGGWVGGLGGRGVVLQFQQCVRSQPLLFFICAIPNPHLRFVLVRVQLGDCSLICSTPFLIFDLIRRRCMKPTPPLPPSNIAQVLLGAQRLAEADGQTEVASAKAHFALGAFYQRQQAALAEQVPTPRPLSPPMHLAGHPHH